MKNKSFSNKVIVVTGGASGIGAAISEKFGREGCRVVILDIDPKATVAKAEELKQAGIDALGLKCDVTDEKQCEIVFREIIKKYKGIDILVNNAGLTQRSPFLETGIAVYRKVIDVNFFGAVNCTKAAINSLIKRKGMIIVTSSIAGTAPILGRSGYCASKHALHGFFGVLRSELRQQGVHVLIVCPGFTQTNLQTRALDGDGSVTHHPQSTVGKQSSPEDVANAVYSAAVKRKRIAVLSPVGKISYVLVKFFPRLFEKLQTASLKKELERSGTEKQSKHGH